MLEWLETFGSFQSGLDLSSLDCGQERSPVSFGLVGHRRAQTPLVQIERCATVHVARDVLGLRWRLSAWAAGARRRAFLFERVASHFYDYRSTRGRTLRISGSSYPSAKSMFPRVAWLYGEILSWVSSTSARASAVGRFAHDWHLRVPAVPQRHCRLGREHPCWAVRKPFSHAMHGRRSTDPALRSIPRERSCNHAASLAACGYGSTHFALSVATDAPNRRRRPRLPAISKAELPDTRQRVD